MWFLVLIVALCILSQVSLIEGGYIRSSLVQSLFPTHKFHRRAHVSTMSLETQYFALENPSAMHKIVIAVKMLNFDRLTNLVDEVSDPRSRHYGQHLSRDKVAQMIGNPAAVETIKQYLHEQGATIVKVSTHGEFITAEAPVTTWNKVFDTQLHKCSVRNHITEETNTFIRAKEYSLPVALVDHVAEVFNLVQVPPAVQKHIKVHKVQKKAKESGNGLARSAVNQSAYFPNSVTPAFINSYYNISNNTGSSLITQSVYETSNQSASPSDLTIFQTIFGLPNQSIAEDIGNHVFDGACETSDGSDDCDEANLDVQYLMGVAQNSPTVFYYWGGEDFMLDWITEVADMSKPPTIFSISYGAYEEEYDSAYLYAFNQQAVILAAIGTTIFVSSGDDGVAGYLVRDKPQLCGYYPQFPASSPMVTTVGATNGPQEGRTEVVCQSNENGALITTGGGFSNIYPRPSWQKTEVATYFSTVAGTEKAPEEGYSLTGRGYPDVALLGHAYVVIIGGQNSSVDGTSASAPVMAAFATLVNSRRVELGLSTLGWLNPALYYYSDSFIRDITAGNNNCTASDTCCSEGFYAAPGWDPTTGLGSVMFDRFLSTLGANVTLYKDAYDDVLSAGSNGNDKHKLTKGEIAGIVIGVFIGAAAIALAIAVFVFGFGRGHLSPLLYSATSNEK